MDESKPLSFGNRTSWRKWLQANHLKKNHIWIAHYKKHAKKTGLSHEDALEEALCFGWIDGKLKSIDDEKYMLRYSPRKKNSNWSKSNRTRAEKLIKQGLMTESGLAKIDEAGKNGKWDAAYSLKSASPSSG